MTRENYISCMEFVKKLPFGEKGVQTTGKFLTYATAICYVVAITAQGLDKMWTKLAVLTLVPAVSFVLLSLFRRVFNAKRPYEVYDFKPLIPKDTKGKSFPSRHVFSIFVIGSTLVWYYPYAGVLICLMGCLLAGIRIITGVHFPKDVIAGAIIGILCGCITGILF